MFGYRDENDESPAAVRLNCHHCSPAAVRLSCHHCSPAAGRQSCHHCNPAAVRQSCHHCSTAAVRLSCHDCSPAAVRQSCHHCNPAAVRLSCHHCSPAAVRQSWHHCSPAAVRQSCHHCSFKQPALLNAPRTLARAPLPCTRVTQLSASHFSGCSRFRAEEKVAVKAVASCALQFSTQSHYNRSVRGASPHVGPECAGMWNNCFIDLPSDCPRICPSVRACVQHSDRALRLHVCPSVRNV